MFTTVDTVANVSLADAVGLLWVMASLSTFAITVFNMREGHYTWTAQHVVWCVLLTVLPPLALILGCIYLIDDVVKKRDGGVDLKVKR